MPPNRFESEVESFLEGSHGDRTHIKRADHHAVTPLCGTLLGANFFAHRTQPRADFETNDTSAATDVGQHETAITNATEKRTKNTHFSPAKATAVSVEARPTRAKATPVSTQHSHKVGKASPVSPQRSDALDTEPMHQIAQHCTGN